MKFKLLVLFTIMGYCSAVFSLDKPVIFDTAAAFSWYPLNNFAGAMNEEGGFNYNLQLSMGLKLFKKMSAYVNMDIDDPTMKKLINVAGALGSKYFGVQFDYHKVRGESI